MTKEETMKVFKNGSKEQISAALKEYWKWKEVKSYSPAVKVAQEIFGIDH